MNMQQGFSMTFKPVDNELGLYNLRCYSHLSINEKLITRDVILAMHVELDPDWIEKIPVDQFAVLALEVASQVFSTQNTPAMVEAFKKDIAQAVGEIVIPLLED